jgi:uncharacterized protein (TIGR02646 family)
MIRIAKGKPPRKLTGDGVARARTHCRDYDADPISYQSGTKRLMIAEGIYAHPTVRKALELRQHAKCCYCEAQPEKPYAHLHVEHWRPKAYSKQFRDAEELRPGYYWLAYDWDNLFLSCHFCNSSNKGNIFPLSNPDARARNHHADLAAERPLLLKPDGMQDPRDHIGFHEEVPIGRTPEGRATIAILGLDRTEHAVRLRLFNQLKRCREVIVTYRHDLSPAAVEWVAEARAFIVRAVRAEAPFSAMSMAFVERNPLPA